MIAKSDLARQPISTIESLFLEKSFNPHDLLDALLENIRKYEDKVHSFICVSPEGALRREADYASLSLKNEYPPLMCGIPIAVKDNTNVAKMPCSGGSKLFRDNVANDDAFSISKLRRAGAYVVGKSNLDEMAAFGIATNNPHFGRTFNPWNLFRIPGGSSGGSAAAVASGEAVVATGSDTGGSVRIPASFCGLVGHKPTYGGIGRTGTIGMSWSLDHLGVISRSVRDAALMSFIMSGIDPNDSSTIGAPETKRYVFPDSPDLDNIKVGVLANPLRESDEVIMHNFAASIDEFSKLGAKVCEFTLPHLEDITPAIFAIALAETAAYHQQWLRSSPELYGDTLKNYVQLGHGILATQYLKAQRQKTVITKEVANEFRKVDVIILPTAPSIAPMIGEDIIEIQGKKYPAFQVLTENTYPFNFLGLPAISLPNGFSDGMPTGLQIISAHWREDFLYRVGDAYQQVTDYHTKVPPL